MLTILEKGIGGMTVFIICAQTIVHFRPKASYEKYLKMLISIFILMQLLQAVEGAFSRQGQNFLLQQTREYREKLQRDLTQSVDTIWNLSDSTENLLGGLIHNAASDNLDDRDFTENGSSNRHINPVTVQPIRVQVHVDPICPVTPKEAP